MSFDILRGESLGLVGESGCGKNALGRVILGLYPATEGRVLFEGADVGASVKGDAPEDAADLPGPQRFAEPAETIRAVLEVPFQIHGAGSRAERCERIEALLAHVGLSPYHLSR